MDGFEEYQSPFSAEQIQAYLERINFPKEIKLPTLTANGPISEESKWTVDSREGVRDLQLLRALQVCHLCTIPFETLSLHYSKQPYVSVNPQDIYAKLVTRRRGGYCMEQNTLLYHILRALGFSVYCAGARVRSRIAGQPSGLYMGW